MEAYGTVPDFVLTDQDGRPLSNHDLAGRVWVANFVFTRCRGTCPMLTRKMQEVERWIHSYGDGKIKIVSFSVDPERDTPSDLKKYATMFGIDTNVWKFVTGPEPQIRAVVVNGFKSGMKQVGAIHESPAAGDTLFDILHGERFVLVDPQGEIRGFYSA
ncbi:MAG: SCO family protein, partial [Kiloniellales bacterium]|nr:SCO family protein [Kiloniellales bacterium]